LRVDKKIVWATTICGVALNDFDVSIFEIILHESIEKKSDNELSWTIKNILIFIKTNCTREIFSQQSIYDFFEIERNRICDLSVAEIKRFEKSNLIIKIEIHAEIDKDLVAVRKRIEKETIKLAKRSHDVLSSDFVKSVTFVLKRSLICTDKLKTQAAWMKSAKGDIERQNKKLINRWRCTDEKCLNEQKKKWCFVDWEEKHYDMNHTQMHNWIKALQQIWSLSSHNQMH
jgi:predicted XRE-type DNA-binding protein